MIERPPSGLPPRERRTLRCAGLTVLGGTTVAVVAGILMAIANVSDWVAAAVMLAVATGTACAVLFGILKLHHDRAELRRQRKRQTRSTRLKQGIPMLILAGLIDVSIWKQQGNASLAAVLAGTLGLSVIWMVIDVWRAPRG